MNKPNRPVFRVLFLTLAFLLVVTMSSSSLLSRDVQAPNGTIHALTAISLSRQKKGLSGRDSLSADQGMLFFFSNEGEHPFWMKDMRFPLDIVWISSTTEVVGISPDISPDTYPEAFFPPSPISYVLELNAGQAEKFGIVTGTKLSF